MQKYRENARNKKTHKPKQTTQRHLCEPHSFYCFINMNKHCPVCMNKNIVSGYVFKGFGPQSSLVMSQLDIGHGQPQWMTYREYVTANKGQGLTWPSCVIQARELTCN